MPRFELLALLMLAAACAEPVPFVTVQRIPGQDASAGQPAGGGDSSKKGRNRGVDVSGEDGGGSGRVVSDPEDAPSGAGGGIAADPPPDAGLGTGTSGGAAGAASTAGQGGGDAGAGSAAPMPVIGAVGTWYGPTADSLGPTFNACVTLMQVDMPGLAGTSRYVGPGINCRGNLSFVEAAGNVYSFTETITSGSGCMPAGRIDLTINGDATMTYNWFRSNVTVPQEVGTLDRVDECP